jgi:PTS system glucitol/sorbitol-specific IIB component
MSSNLNIPPTTPGTDSARYSPVQVNPGRGGWGRGLLITPDAKRNKVISVTGGGIHPVAQRIADLSGAEVVDGFRVHVADEEVLCAVINCGGTARIGVYPRKRIPTVDVFPGEPGGPLAQFITDDIFVSAVGPEDVQPAGRQDATVGAGTRVGGVSADGPATARLSPHETSASTSGQTHPLPEPPEPTAPDDTRGFFVKFGSAIGYIINTFLSAGRQTINLVINTILPFMAYVSLLLGIVTYTGIAEQFGEWLQPLASNPLGLVAIGLVVALPILSPILGPGAAIAQIVGVLMGTQIGAGVLPVQYALPTLFAINGQVGADFVPVGLGLGEAKAETVEVGVPAVLFSRVITSPLAVIIAWAASFGL